MKSLRVVLLVILAFIYSSIFSTSILAQDNISVPRQLVHYPDTIVINGVIYTMDNKDLLSSDPGSVAEAIAIDMIGE